MILIRTPLRVSFFGGGTDHPDWFIGTGSGAVLSTSITKYIYLQLRRLPSIFPFNYRVVWREVEQVSEISEIKHPVVRAVLSHYGADDECGYEVVYNADLPARSGLGSSSAFTVACLQAYHVNCGRYVAQRDLAREAIFVEQSLLKEPVGCQDQVAVAHGGLNRIDFRPEGGYDISPVAISAERRLRLQDSLMMFFTGFTRNAGDVEKAKKANFAQKYAELNRMYEMVGEGVRILEDRSFSIDDFGSLLHEAWTLKRSLASAVSSSAIDDLYARARGAGAIGGKLLGAGGGGFMLFFVPPSRQENVKAALAEFVHVPLNLEQGGSRVVMYDPDMTSNYEARFSPRMIIGGKL